MTHHPGPDQKPPITSPFTTRPERFELPTFGSVDRRSIQLSYGRLAIDSNCASSGAQTDGRSPVAKTSGASGWRAV